MSVWYRAPVIAVMGPLPSRASTIRGTGLDGEMRGGTWVGDAVEHLSAP
jgi:hypothetical protein